MAVVRDGPDLKGTRRTGRRREPRQYIDTKADTVAKVRAWIGRSGRRAALAAEYFPAGVVNYPEADIMACLVRMAATNLNPAPIDEERVRRELWGDDPA